jgi:hypothetical protein
VFPPLAFDVLSAGRNKPLGLRGDAVGLTELLPLSVLVECREAYEDKAYVDVGFNDALIRIVEKLTVSLEMVGPLVASRSDRYPTVDGPKASFVAFSPPNRPFGINSSAVSSGITKNPPESR